MGLPEEGAVGVVGPEPPVKATPPPAQPQLSTTRRLFARLARRLSLCQRHLEWLVFLAGLATPAIMALVVTPDAPTMLPLTPAHVAKGTNRCRVAAPPTVDLFYACQGATPHQVAPCYSEYYWAVTVSLEVLHVTTTSAGGGGNATAEVVTSPREAPTQLTVRPHTPWLADASALASRFVPDGRVPCTVDAVTGAVRVHDNFTLPAALPTGAAARQGTAGPGSPGVASLRRHHPVSGGPLPGSPGPLAVVVLHALWGSFLDGLGVARRPPPLWLIRMGWLPWWRVVGPGVPLISLSSLLTAVRLAELRTSLLDAVIVPVMLAAAAEAACAVLAEAQAAAHERARSGASMLPVWCALAYVLSAAALVLLCVAQPVARELRRGWRALSGSGDGAMAPHPLGEPLRRSNSGRLRPLTRSQTMGLRID